MTTTTAMAATMRAEITSTFAGTTHLAIHTTVTAVPGIELPAPMRWTSTFRVTVGYVLADDSYSDDTVDHDDADRLVYVWGDGQTRVIPDDLPGAVADLALDAAHAAADAAADAYRAALVDTIHGWR